MVCVIEVIADGARPVVVKRATGATAADLQREAARLQQAAHPGVVEVLSSSGGVDHWELRMVHGGRSIASGGSTSVRAAAGIVAAVAATVADLHDVGIVHGRIDPSHVLVGSHGRPVLCGFGSDPGASTPADDVADLGALLVGLVGEDAEMEPIPERRWWPRRSWSGWERRSLLLLADQASADPPTRRPTARRLAAAICDAVPIVDPAGAVVERRAGARSGSADEAAQPASRRSPQEDPRPGATARPHSVVMAAAGLVALGVAALRLVGASPAVPPTRSDVGSAEVTTTAAAPDQVDTLPTTATSVPAPCVRLGGSASGSAGCVADVRIDGTAVVLGDQRYEIGLPGDVVVLGDWDCDGAATAALLRPTSGDVFVFDTWATSEDVTVGPSGSAPGATGLERRSRSSGCDGLIARGADGTELEVLGGPLPADGRS